MTITNDIRCVSPHKPTQRIRIIFQGGSIAALASASLLASDGHEVIIFEKDVDVLELDTDRKHGRVSGFAVNVGHKLCSTGFCLQNSSMREQVPGRNVDGSIRRAGVPQFRQLHTMLRRGLIDFEHIIPGFSSALQAAGAVNINFLMDTCGVRRVLCSL